MPRITIELSISESLALKNLVKSLNESVTESNTSHGKLTAKRLLTMLTEDAAMVESRPGCWEAANMTDVLHGHGYSTPN